MNNFPIDGLSSHSHPNPNVFSPPDLNLPPPQFFSVPPPFYLQKDLSQRQDLNNSFFSDSESENLWVETTSSDGKPYFYNAKTRQTLWSVPEGAKVMTHSELETRTTKNSEVKINNEDLKKEIKMEKNDELKEEEKEHESLVIKIKEETEEDGMERNKKLGSAPQTDEEKLIKSDYTIDEFKALMMHARIWSEHVNEEGRSYYYNNISMQSQWEKPKILQQLIEASKLMISKGVDVSRINISQDLFDPYANTPFNILKARAKAREDEEDEEEEEMKEKENKIEENKNRIEESGISEVAKFKRKQEASKPIYTKAVPGTPWCMVWTKDEKTFFYNPSINQSTWTVPRDLETREDVATWLIRGPPVEYNHQPKKAALSSHLIDPTTPTASSQAALLNPPGSLGSSEPADKKPKYETAPKQFGPYHPPMVLMRSDLPSHLQGNPRPQCADVFGQIKKKEEEEEKEKEKKKESEKEEKIEEENLVEKEEETKANKEEDEEEDKGSMSMEERNLKFMELLAEKQVSAFSTWEKEMPKLAGDSRFQLLPIKDRKPAFELYLRGRCEEERKEKLMKVKIKKDQFKQFLTDCKVTPRTTFSEFNTKFGRDPRMKLIEKPREREVLFSEHIVQLKKKENSDSKYAVEHAKLDFFQMVKDRIPSNLLNDPGVQWSVVKGYTQCDSRYRLALDHSHLCEAWLKEYCSSLRQINAVKAGEKREEGEYEESEREIEMQKREKEKKDRIDASLRQREKIVQESLNQSLQERDKERKIHQREESIQHFKALIVDMVKNPEESWREARHRLHKDSRWELASHIDKTEKEKLFEEHVESIIKKNKTSFHRLLDEVLGGSLVETWKNVKRVIKDDVRAVRFSSSDKKREREFDSYLVQRRVKAKQEFRELLKETKLINLRSQELTSDPEQHMKDIIAILQNDKRYLVLDSMADERQEILDKYIEEVSSRAPSPPPTASEPRSRNIR